MFGRQTRRQIERLHNAFAALRKQIEEIEDCLHGPLVHPRYENNDLRNKSHAMTNRLDKVEATIQDHAQQRKILEGKVSELRQLLYGFDPALLLSNEHGLVGAVRRLLRLHTPKCAGCERPLPNEPLAHPHEEEGKK